MQRSFRPEEQLSAFRLSVFRGVGGRLRRGRLRRRRRGSKTRFCLAGAGRPGCRRSRRLGGEGLCLPSRGRWRRAGCNQSSYHGVASRRGSGRSVQIAALSQRVGNAYRRRCGSSGDLGRGGGRRRRRRWRRRTVGRSCARGRRCRGRRRRRRHGRRRRSCGGPRLGRARGKTAGRRSFIDERRRSRHPLRTPRARRRPPVDAVGQRTVSRLLGRPGSHAHARGP